MKKIVPATVALYIALAMLGMWFLPSIRSTQDIGVYRGIGEMASKQIAGEQVELRSEYPPLMTTIFWGMLNSPWHDSFASAWLLFLFLALAGAGLYLWFIAREEAAIFLLATVLSIFLLGQAVFFARNDMLVMIPLYLSWRAHIRKLPASGAFFLIIAGALKFIPFLLLPLSFLSVARLQRKQWLSGALLAAFLCLALPLAILSPQGTIENVHHVFTYHGSRTFQAESVWSSTDMLIRRAFLGEKAKIGMDHMAYHNHDLPVWAAHAALLIMIIGIVLLTARAWLRSQKKGWNNREEYLLLLLWILLTSSILSPQYFVWLLPLLVAWGVDTCIHDELRLRQGLIMLSTVIIGFSTQLIMKEAMSAQSLLLVSLLNLRAAVMVCLFLLLFYSTRQRVSKH
ncbi:MAG TPA: hypothetical protein DEB30_05700 [Candidatus Peribacter riflensis]|uniref:DUF2029 domain-containing protein n=1 Tax=Candidatus Peribacter riflensis TaxID=1735162 RepID=A0A0S1SUS1_9BACT|nr:MAG: hypothetical protein PeribacterA2_0056 [Candidatus Peribacter riflensis]OGJ78162.1 MAG: hypothetical protein A2398_02060 [Candidatus Peribacteria bacterium RIFOXYB1_FULL_57_12]OGJ82818.1 MAG: hypothetical protein A2412_02535 [Candidatus Peribacteria bacterium RIFOXYC1_FULL_58_8]ALM10555.1 MAG: hypothetical protein PeribacterB2_0056 [Candidatus Peribacter riflensis]ALM11658.1 MAG: hypothetical protein PeribacterC2_0056 [Candidatus Peribacter riflensis]